MKTYAILLIFAVCSFTYGNKCPQPEGLPVKKIDDVKLLGDWIMLANKPEWNEKCKNITVKNTTTDGRVIHEEYFKKELHLWRRHATKDYNIVRHLEPTPVLELKKRSWYSFGTLKLRVISVDYEKYIVLYNCHKEYFSLSELVEIWVRHDVAYNSQNIPKEIRDVLAKFKISIADLAYRKGEDCRR